MAKTLSQIIGWENLTGVIQDPKGGIPADILPPEFATPSRQVMGNAVTYYKVAGNRQTARLAQYGSPSQRRTLTGVTEATAIMLHTAEHIVHKPDTLEMLRDFDNPMRQKMGEQLVAQQTAQFARLYSNLRLATVYQALASGNLWFDNNGNLLPSATGAAVTVNYGVPTGNTAQLNVFGTGNLLTAGWETASTNIATQIKKVKQAAVQLSGYPLKHAFYGVNVLGYLSSNTTLQTLIRGNPGFSQQFLQQEIPDGFLGLDWHPVENAFYADQNGNIQTFFGPDTVVFTPEPDPEWWEFVEGSYPVPTDIMVKPDMESALQTFSNAFGKFSYGVITVDPPGVKQVAGDNFLPLLKVARAIFQANVNF